MKAILSKLDQGPVLRAFGEEVQIHLSGEQTGGLFTMFTEITPPGGGPPPHWHENEDEWFHVLEGTLSFLVDGRWVDAHPGDSVLAPRNQVHTFKNNTSQATKMLIQTSPSGFEKFFAMAAEEFAKPEGPDMQRAMHIAEAHGIHFVA
jgi:quercetin dioxygenase-like cupin family protein